MLILDGNSCVLFHKKNCVHLQHAVLSANDMLAFITKVEYELCDFAAIVQGVH